MPKVKTATVVERRAREALLREEHILAVVKALIRKGGAAEVSIRRVAEQAGFSTTVVYAHFKDKATLITRALDADLLALVAAMRAAVGGSADTAECLQRAGLAYVAFGLAHSDEYQLVFMEPRPHAPVDAAQVEHGNADQDPYAFAFGLIEAFARERLGFGVARALLTAHQVQMLHLMTQMYWQSLHGLVSLNIVMGPTDPWAPHIDPAANATAAMEVLLAGFVERFGLQASGQ